MRTGIASLDAVVNLIENVSWIDSDRVFQVIFEQKRLKIHSLELRGTAVKQPVCEKY